MEARDCFRMLPLPHGVNAMPLFNREILPPPIPIHHNRHVTQPINNNHNQLAPIMLPKVAALPLPQPISWSSHNSNNNNLNHRHPSNLHLPIPLSSSSHHLQHHALPTAPSIQLPLPLPLPPPIPHSQFQLPIPVAHSAPRPQTPVSELLLSGGIALHLPIKNNVVAVANLVQPETAPGKDYATAEEDPRRCRLNPYQRYVLLQIFDRATAFPSTALREKIANTLGLRQKTVQNWFQNQRQLRQAQASPAPNEENSDAVGSSSNKKYRSNSNLRRKDEWHIHQDVGMMDRIMQSIEEEYRKVCESAVSRQPSPSSPCSAVITISSLMNPPVDIQSSTSAPAKRSAVGFDSEHSSKRALNQQKLTFQQHTGNSASRKKRHKKRLSAQNSIASSPTPIQQKRNSAVVNNNDSVPVIRSFSISRILNNPSDADVNNNDLCAGGSTMSINHLLNPVAASAGPYTKKSANNHLTPPTSPAFQQVIGKCPVRDESSKAGGALDVLALICTGQY